MRSRHPATVAVAVAVNGLLRDHFSKGTDPSVHTAGDIALWNPPLSGLGPGVG